MSDLREMTRVLCRHDWTRIEQWASSLDQLADLTDDEIEDLDRLARLSHQGHGLRGAVTPTGQEERAA